MERFKNVLISENNTNIGIKWEILIGFLDHSNVKSQESHTEVEQLKILSW